jgi:hypothetical protein
MKAAGRQAQFACHFPPTSKLLQLRQTATVCFLSSLFIILLLWGVDGVGSG